MILIICFYGELDIFEYREHDFLCINICGSSREMLKPEPERGGFQSLPRVRVDVNVIRKACLIVIIA